MTKRLTPVQQRIITIIGSKQIHQEEWCESPAMMLTWIAEALEHLLLREIELTATKDNVNLDDLIEEIQNQGAAECKAAAMGSTT
jgi:hypothetical protein